MECTGNGGANLLESRRRIFPSFFQFFPIFFFGGGGDFLVTARQKEKKVHPPFFLVAAISPLSLFKKKYFDILN
jgi:hypothetical protein